VWFDASLMPEYHSILYPVEPEEFETKRAAIAIAILVALFSLLAFARPHDPTKVVSGTPCSVLSERDISSVLGTEMRLMPTSGTICQYVSTGAGASRTLFVIARHDAAIPVLIARESVAVPNVGDAAMRSPNAVYVRYGAHSYTFDIVPASPSDPAHTAEELRLAKMMHRPMIAQNH
jgi:hypothetical protein